jgi:anti-sigma factor RsiW
MREHLAQCSECRAVASTLGRGVSALRQLASEAAGELQDERMLARLRPAMQSLPARRRVALWQWATGGAGAIATLLLVGVWLAKTEPEPIDGELLAWHGAVSLVHGDAAEQVAGKVTLVAGHQLEVPAGSRALARLGRLIFVARRDTRLEVAELTRARARLRIGRGEIVARVDPDSSTPPGAVVRSRKKEMPMA